MLVEYNPQQPNQSLSALAGAFILALGKAGYRRDDGKFFHQGIELQGTVFVEKAGRKVWHISTSNYIQRFNYSKWNNARKGFSVQQRVLYINVAQLVVDTETSRVCQKVSL